MNILERLRPVLICGLALLCVTAGIARADQKTVAKDRQPISRVDQKEEAKKLVIKAREQIFTEFDRKFLGGLTPGNVECWKKYHETVKKLREKLAQCLNDPGNNSPLDKFNALNNTEMINFCASRGFGGPPLDLVACANYVMRKEQAFCDEASWYTHYLQFAEGFKYQCLECDKLLPEVRKLQEKYHALFCPWPKSPWENEK